MKVVLLSPDTGQQGDLPSGKSYVHALSGKAVRTLFSRSVMKLTIQRRVKRQASARFLSSNALSLSALAVHLLCVSGAMAQTLLPDTVITASRVMQRAQDALPDVTLLTRAEIERSQTKDVPSLLQQLAGLEVTQSGGMGGVATLFMRGAESRHALVLVDGLPMNNLNFNLAALEHLPLSGIERIEVVRGNVSSLYGSAALGGVVHIFTRQNSGAALKSPWLESSVQVGSEAYRSAQVSAGQKWASGFGVNAAMEHVQTSGFNAINPLQRPGTNPDRDGYKRQSSALNFSQEFESGRLGLMLRDTQANVQYDSQYGPANQADESRSILRSAVLNAHVQASQNLTVDVSVGEQEDKLNAAITAYPYFVNSKSQTSTVGAVWTLWPQHDITAGYENTRQKIASDTEYSPAQRSSESWRLGYQAKLAQHQWQLNVRQDQYSDFGNANTWYAAYAYWLSPAWRLKASASTGFMAPTFNDLYYPWGGNAHLKPEQARSNEVGLQYTQSQLQWRMTAFENRYIDLIDNDANWTRTNIAKAKNQGVEMSLSGQWQLAGVGAQKWRLSVTSQDPQNDITHQALARRAKTLVQAGLNQNMAEWDTGVQMRYSGARQDASKTLPSFTVLDITASKAISQEWRLNARIENLGNVHYQTIYGYNMPSRGFFVGLKWTPVL
jgi:vitamin B12 transporter